MRAWLLIPLVSGLVAGAAPRSARAESPRNPASAVVATIDGKPLTLEELLFRLASLPAQLQEGYLGNEGGLARFLEDAVSNIAVAREAEALGLDKGPLYQRSLALRREEVLRDMYARRTVLREADEAALAARYEASRSRFQLATSVRLRHILVTVAPSSDAARDVARSGGVQPAAEGEARAKAEALRAEILAGAGFGDVARRSSADASASSGGDLGWVDPGTLVPDLAEAARSLTPGKVSGVIRSSLGFHIVRVEARQEAGTIPLESVRELLFQEVAGGLKASSSDEVRRLREEVRARHRVETFPDRLPR